MNIVMYSTGCPKCSVLKQKLNNANIKYELIEDTPVVIDKCKELGTNLVPFLVVDNTKVYNFIQAVEFIKEIEH